MLVVVAYSRDGQIIFYVFLCIECANFLIIFDVCLCIERANSHQNFSFPIVPSFLFYFVAVSKIWIPDGYD